MNNLKPTDKKTNNIISFDSCNIPSLKTLIKQWHKLYEVVHELSSFEL